MVIIGKEQAEPHEGRGNDANYISKVQSNGGESRLRKRVRVLIQSESLGFQNIPAPSYEYPQPCRTLPAENSSVRRRYKRDCQQDRPRGLTS